VHKADNIKVVDVTDTTVVSLISQN